MAEGDLQSNLQNYKLQLQQVDAALTTDPYNEELLKLKGDLDEVIQLTLELIKTQTLEEEKSVKEYLLDDEGDDNSIATKANHMFHSTKEKEWKVGDKCTALWSEDGQYHPATIESIDGEEVSVIFEHNMYKGAEVTTLEFIREMIGSQESNIKSKVAKRMFLSQLLQDRCRIDTEIGKVV
uniref:Tudor domain-containing protein n=1 Tax=Clastoptera arizonana TaxID=38151 RepID=A0A1B6CYU6_9HEMI